MSTTAAATKNADLSDLLVLAADVRSSLPAAFRAGNARDAVRAITGVAAWLANRVGVERMQACMAELAQHDAAWSAPFMRSLPTQYNNMVDESVALLATVTSPLAIPFGAQNLRAAMAWWATERDTAAWQAVLGC